VICVFVVRGSVHALVLLYIQIEVYFMVLKDYIIKSYLVKQSQRLPTRYQGKHFGINCFIKFWKPWVCSLVPHIRTKRMCESLKVGFLKIQYVEFKVKSIWINPEKKMQIRAKNMVHEPITSNSYSKDTPWSKLGGCHHSLLSLVENLFFQPNAFDYISFSTTISTTIFLILKK
jgi:hypothetical protein